MAAVNYDCGCRSRLFSTADYGRQNFWSLLQAPSNDRLDSGSTLRGKNYDRLALSRLFSVPSYDSEAQNELRPRGGRFGGGKKRLGVKV